jgi:hypothetical protein
MRDALGLNPAFSGDELSAAVACERALYQSARSETVYISTAANAIRVAHTVGDVAELVRIARGQPKDEGGDTGEAALDVECVLKKAEY